MSVPQEEVLAYLSTFPGLDVYDAPQTRFFYYDPHRDTPHDKRQPFATVVAADDYDSVSNLSRPGVYRINIGVARETYRALLGPEPPWNMEGGTVETGHDFAALDTFLPHPYYAPMGWICILNPSEERWPRVRELLQEAHAIAAQQFERRRRTE